MGGKVEGMSGPAAHVLDTERLSLRCFHPEDDAPFVLELLNDPAFLRYIGDKGVRTLEDSFRDKTLAWRRRALDP